MIIPISRKEKCNIGDKVIITEQIDYHDYLMITVGHEFTISDYDKDYDKYTLIDSDGIVIDKIISSSFTEIVSIENANDKFKEKEYYDSLRNLLLYKCSHSVFVYRDDAYRCTLDENYCKPRTECLKYVDYSNVTIITDYIRTQKLKSIIEDE